MECYVENYIENFINLYEEKNSKLFKEKQNPSQIELKGLYWIASNPVISGQILSWFYLQEEYSISKNQIGSVNLEDLALILNNLSPKVSLPVRSQTLEKISQDKNLKNILELFHNQGLVCV